MAGETPSSRGGSEPPLRSIGRYEIVRRIASGGMATVFRARVRGVDGFSRAVAIKLCHPHLREDPAFVAMFLDEARIASSIHHANVVATLDLGREDSLYIVMEYVDGGRLSDLLRPKGAPMQRIAAPIALRIMLDALAGLEAAHEALDERGQPLLIVHRDVSPQNILVGRDGVTRVADFGIAKAAARASVTATGQVKGKLAYMAPEQLRGAPIDRRIDVFAAAIVLWEMLTGRRLFAADSEAEVTGRVLNAQIEPPSAHAPDIPPALDAALLRALSRTVEDRTASARAFADELEQCGVTIASSRAVAALVAERLAVETAVDDGPELASSGRQTAVATDAPRGLADEPNETRAERPTRSSGSKTAPVLVAIGALSMIAALGATALRVRASTRALGSPSPDASASATPRSLNASVEARASIADAGAEPDAARDAQLAVQQGTPAVRARPTRSRRGGGHRTQDPGDEFIPSGT